MYQLSTTLSSPVAERLKCGELLSRPYHLKSVPFLRMYLFYSASSTVCRIDNFRLLCQRRLTVETMVYRPCIRLTSCPSLPPWPISPITTPVGRHARMSLAPSGLTGLTRIAFGSSLNTTFTSPSCLRATALCSLSHAAISPRYHLAIAPAKEIPTVGR